jgi:hypothetical protein
MSDFMTRFLLIVLLLANTLVYAEEGSSSDSQVVMDPDQPELPAQVKSGEPMEPDVTIIRRGNESIEEYRINNHVYMLKITPAIGPSYYMTDKDGDGNMDVRQSYLQSGMNINKWVLFSW